jgi:hypothetical protein
MPGTRDAKKNGIVLIASDPCPNGCASALPNSAIHLVSDHSASLGQCSKCACIIQEVRNHIGRDAAKIGK